jgi:hypothetical protein
VGGTSHSTAESRIEEAEVMALSVDISGEGSQPLAVQVMRSG